MGEDFNYAAYIKRAETHLNEALCIIQKLPVTDTIKITEGIIQTNLGACYLEIYGRITKDLNSVRKAREHHLNGLKIKESILRETELPELDQYKSIGASYNAIATDCFKLANYEESLIYHREAIKNREQGNDKNIRKIESYIRCIGTLMKLLWKNGEKTKEY